MRTLLLLTALVLGTAHLIAYWGQVPGVIDLLWLPPVGAMLLRPLWDAARNHSPRRPRLS